MKRGRGTIVLVTFCIIMLITNASIQTDTIPLPKKHNNEIKQQNVISDIFNFRSAAASVVNNPDIQNIRDIVRVLSEDYHDRLWYNLDRKPNDQLEGAWQYINSTIISATGGKVHFKHWTEEMTLVGVLNGTTNESPIIIAGTISSRASPGANMFAASAAAVVESARILSKYNHTNPIMFVLTNTITGMYGTGDTGNAGFRAFLNELETLHRVPVAVFWYSYLLYKETSTPKIQITSTYNQSYFNTQEAIARLALKASSLANGILIKTAGAIGSWRRTGAYDANDRGIPSFVFEQSYTWAIPSWDDDVWNYWYYDYDQAVEAIGVVSALTRVLEIVASGKVLAFQDSIAIGASGSRSISVPLTGITTMMANFQWSENTTVRASVIAPTGSIIGSNNSTTGNLMLTCNITVRNEYYVLIENIGNNTATVSYTISQPQDLDDDTLDDVTEIAFGSDPISVDTDGDGLQDPDEYKIGTDPRSKDSDMDGVMDGLEVELNANPLLKDTDNDTLTDGFEVENGLNPASNDTDNDGLLDGEEFEYGSDPLNPDTDGDGLIDGLEIQYGTNVNNTDTDGDGLNDLFEVLNNLDPHTSDTDGDGLSDYYEIENDLLPFNADTDGDMIPDSDDWNPKVHWIYDAPMIGLVTVLLFTTIWLARKRREYMASEK